MKRMLLAAALLAASVSGQQQVTTAIGVPHTAPQKVVTAIKESFWKILEGSSPGDRVVLFDATTDEMICSVEVPTGTTARARMRKMVPLTKKAFAFFKRSTSAGAQSGAEQIRLPQFLNTIATDIRPNGGTTRVLVFGEPRYLDARDGDSFKRGVVPNDAFITASSDRSTYGTSDRRGTLKGTTVHWAYVTDGFVNERERRAIQRFWHLYCAELGATLTSFHASEPVVRRRLLANASNPILPNAKLDRSAKEFVMVNYAVKPKDQKAKKPRPVERAKPKPRVAPSPKASKHTAQVTQTLKAAAKKIAIPATGGHTFGALWLDTTASRVDVDLYVRAHSEAEELYFSHKKTVGGRHLGDVVTSQVPSSDADWKATAEIVELQDASLRDVEVWVNLFSNKAGNRVEGIVRVVNHAGQCCDVPFAFEGQADAGAGRSTRVGLAAWQKIDVSKRALSAASN